MSRGESESEGEWSPWGEGEEEEAGRPLIAPSLAPAQPQSQTCGGPDDSLAASLVSSRPAHTPQYFTALSATMGALAMGTVLGYSSPAGAKLMSNSTGDTLHLTKDQNSLFSSTMNIGALLGGPLGGLCLNAIGRRGTMLASVFPFITGWLMIVCAESFMMLVVGRVLTGLCVGVTSLAVPTYIGEYSSPDIRGTLGSGFQLMVTVGVLYTYSLGAVVSSWRWLAALCILPLLLYLVLMFFAKESPCYCC